MTSIEKLIDQVINPLGNSPIYHCLLSFSDNNKGSSFQAARGTYQNKPVTKDFAFKTGSMTKPFTATIVLQLAEEGLLTLEDHFLSLLPPEKRAFFSQLHMMGEHNFSRDITIKQLLLHQTGLCDYVNDDETFLSSILKDPNRFWSWQNVIESYFGKGLNKQPKFRPGTDFHYSDTNYLLLAVLVEYLTEKSLHQLFEERIFIPFSLQQTYLEYHQTPKSSNTVISPCYGTQSLENVNTSFDWGGGGLVSNLHDLTLFLSLLFEGRFFKNKETLHRMLPLQDVQPNLSINSGYGLGIQKREVKGYTFYGHSSFYGSMMYYEPTLKMGMVLSLNQAAASLKSEWLFKKTLSVLLEAY